jgi:hypothetical protein
MYGLYVVILIKLAVLMIITTEIQDAGIIRISVQANTGNVRAFRR